MIHILFLFSALVLLPNACQGENFVTLESIARKYNTDSYDYNHVGLYDSLFQGDISLSTRNVLEVGGLRKNTGVNQSLFMWLDFFPNSQIYALNNFKPPDIIETEIIKKNANKRLHLLHYEDLKTLKGFQESHRGEMKENSIDIVFDSAHNDIGDQEILLSEMWKYVKPGGYYIIEFIYNKGANLNYRYDPELLTSFTSQVLFDHLSFYADTHIGTKYWNVPYHRCNLLIIRKRKGPIPPISTGKAYSIVPVDFEDVDNARSKPEFMEHLGYKYGTDKSKDDHKFVDVYALLFDPIRKTVKNMTEIGIAFGQSTQLFHDYFPNMHYYGYDQYTHKSVLSNIQKLDRCTFYQLDAYNDVKHEELNIAEESMDIVFDDAKHKAKWILVLLNIWFKHVKKGGFYITENVFYHDGGGADVFMRPNRIQYPSVTKILAENHVTIIDASVGSRSFDFRRNFTINVVKENIMPSHKYHQDNIIVIRRK